MNTDQHLSASAICRKRKKLFLSVICIAIGVACVYSWSEPQTYNAYTQISIDSNDQNPLEEGTSILNKFSFLTSLESEVLTEPQIYHTIMSSESFLTEIGNVHIVSDDSTYTDTFANYLSEKQEKPWWKAFSPQDDLGDLLEENVRLRVNPRNDIITIRVTAQDPFVAFIMVDSIVSHLKSYMTNYMITKADIDKNNKQMALRLAEERYDDAVTAFDNFKDSHFAAKTPSVLVRLEELENEVKTRQQEYNTAVVQYKIATMEAQRFRPTFSTIQSNHKPLEPSNPKWLVNIFVAVFLGLVFTTWYVLLHHKLTWQSR